MHLWLRLALRLGLVLRHRLRTGASGFRLPAVLLWHWLRFCTRRCIHRMFLPKGRYSSVTASSHFVRFTPSIYWPRRSNYIGRPCCIHGVPVNLGTIEVYGVAVFMCTAYLTNIVGAIDHNCLVGIALNDVRARAVIISAITIVLVIVIHIIGMAQIVTIAFVTAIVIMPTRLVEITRLYKNPP